MNAPVLAKYLAPVSTTFRIKGYDHYGTALNLEGERDARSCDITRITAADSEIDLFDMLPSDVVCRIAEAADAQLRREAVKHNAAARADIAKLMRDMEVPA